MGAFENQIMENESFGSLTQLYGDALDKKVALESENAELRDLLVDAVEADDLASLNGTGSLDEEWKERIRERFGPRIKTHPAPGGAS